MFYQADISYIIAAGIVMTLALGGILYRRFSKNPFSHMTGMNHFH
jgi:hypothetical protein